jgi:hypothetical protein
MMWMICRRSLEFPGVSLAPGASIYANATYNPDDTAVNGDTSLQRFAFDAGIL